MFRVERLLLEAEKTLELETRFCSTFGMRKFVGKLWDARPQALEAELGAREFGERR